MFGQSISTLTRLTQGLRRMTITVNTLSTLLLAQLLLPKLQTMARNHPGSNPRLTLVSTALHKFATLKCRKSANIIEALEQPTNDFDMRYNDSKLLLMLYGQKLAATAASADVCITFVNPGYCLSDLRPAGSTGEKVSERILARTTDEGAWTLVDAVSIEKSKGRHGKYIDDMTVKRLVDHPTVSAVLQRTPLTKDKHSQAGAVN